MTQTKEQRAAELRKNGSPLVIPKCQKRRTLLLSRSARSTTFRNHKSLRPRRDARERRHEEPPDASRDHAFLGGDPAHAAARSRLEYEDDKKARRARLKVAPVAKPDPFLLSGDIAEYVTVIEAFAADAEDTELSRAVAALRSQVTRVGNLLARRRETYKEEQR